MEIQRDAQVQSGSTNPQLRIWFMSCLQSTPRFGIAFLTPQELSKSKNKSIVKVNFEFHSFSWVKIWILQNEPMSDIP
ncbi:hypothetical protein PHLCEN_2v8593 [Hermanssonia centrifuga]|uniref:Uncharacterized protein n=1 Tax=Hermanssonia centrifuga TaxID=98765 RepID=A0A2R6NT66_9APHY|nr:hypothetical protein PHLCEN_2v8593 [Hermanssonia centrifuga]